MNCCYPVLRRPLLFVLALSLACLTTSASQAQTAASPNRMTPELLLKLGRLGEAVPSPDGKQIAYTVRRYELEANKGFSYLHILDRASGEDRVLLERWPGIGSLDWMTTSEGPRLFLEATPPAEEGKTTSNQAYWVEPSDGKMHALTSVEDGIANLKVAPGGSRLAFTLDIKMDATAAEQYPDLPQTEGRIIDGLMYRHWNAWHDYKYTHLHVAELGPDGVAGPARDLMEGLRADCPVPPFGGSEQFAWSPDGEELAFTMKNVEDWAQSTNSDVYVIDFRGTQEPRNISADNPGYDNNPVYSPDGKQLAYNSMRRASFESDRNRIMVHQRESGTTTEVTEGLDQNANGFHWSPDSQAVMFESERDGTDQLFRLDVASRSLAPLSKGNYNWHLMGTLDQGQTALVSRTNMIRPAELHTLSLVDGTVTSISGINDDLFEGLELPTVEQRMVTATDGKQIQCWVILPPGFDANDSKKWPLITYCQGGPQGQIGQWFSYRWNFHLMASQGYVIVAPNRRGLPGFGRQWNDQISGDWGGQAMQDILSATDAMMAEPYVDPDRVGAVGASFGGYTVYWLMGNAEDRFKAMIAHCGVFNLESMYGSTEELFFVNWDLGGPYWTSEDVFNEYQAFSPHRFVKNWKTPLLVIHNEKDFRVPVTQGMEAFTAAQVQGVPSRFLYFPDEGHWVLKPQNGLLWHRVFFEWLDRYVKNPRAKTP